MNLRNLSLAVFPLVALFIGWGIQPVGYTKDAVPGSREVWPEFAKAEFRSQFENKSFAINVFGPQLAATRVNRH